MHLIFERSNGRLQSNCNILALAWMPYYAESKFRQALLDYHQKQLINLAHPGQANQQQQIINEAGGSFLNSRLAELYQRYSYLKSHKQSKKLSGASITAELDSRYGRMSEFGWLVIGNVGKIVGVTLTSTVEPPGEVDGRQSSRPGGKNDQDLMVFNDDEANPQDQPARLETGNQPLGKRQLVQYSPEFELLRPDRRSVRSNYNLRGHLDEIILVRWNELYQKLATIDSKGNVLIWCKINEKFTIQTPFYNRTKSVADFRWSNDGKTALICYTDSFILIGSSSGQRHWHSMLNLDDYHITCASWTPNDDQLLLGVSNGNIVVIDLPRSELTELVVSQVNIRTLCWSSYEMNLYNVSKLSSPAGDSRRSSAGSSYRRNSTVVNHRRLSRDCSVFSRYRFCSQAPNNTNSRSSSTSSSSQTPRDHLEPDGPLDNQQAADSAVFESSDEKASPQSTKDDQRNVLAIDFANNTIKLYDGGLEDPEPRSIQVNLESYIMAWSADGKTLAVAGFNIYTSAPTIGCLRCRYSNAIKFYDQRGHLIYQYDMKYSRYPITACTWAHNDQRLFVATGPRLHCAKVYFGIPPLSLLTLACIHRHTRLPDKTDVLEGLLKGHFGLNVLNWQSFNCPIELGAQAKQKLSPPRASSSEQTGSSSDESGQLMKEDAKVSNNMNVLRYELLPLKLRAKIDELFTRTIRQPFDEQLSLNDIVWHVPKNQQRYYCTLVCYTTDPMGRDLSSIGHQYRSDLLDKPGEANCESASDQYKIFVLYAEFQGSLVPILRARRIGFLKPEFVIFDPEDNNGRNFQRYQKVSDVSNHLYLNDFVNRYPATNQEYHQVAGSSTGDYSAGFGENCSDLHSNQSDLMTSSGSFGRQNSLSDAEHYYNFDQCDTNNRQQQRLDRALALNYATATTPVLGGRPGGGGGGGANNNSRTTAGPVDSNLAYLLNLNQLKSIQRHQQAKASLSPMEISRALERYRATTRTSSRLTRAQLPETHELMRVRSNIWGTKFKIVNVSNRMIKQPRAVLGSVTYKASILHLQPRQIFLNLKDMTNFCVLCSCHHHTSIFSHHHHHHQRRPNHSAKQAPKAKNEISLIDLPNVEPIKPQTPLRAGARASSVTPSKSSRKSHRGQHVDNQKVVLSVGDGIRIAPKLERNQKYKFAGPSNESNSQVLLDNQRPSTSRGHIGRAPLKCSIKSSSTTQATNKSATQSPLAKPVTYQASSSEVHKRPGAITYHLFDNKEQDDILTLSLDQGDQVRVEMSSINSGSEQVAKESSSSANRDLDCFLESNKTLKSIQTITKMIVDLSSKADKDDEDEDQDNKEDLVSPTKVLKVSDETSPLGAPNFSKYIPPETPVHRPRKSLSRRHDRDNNLTHLYASQSASATPTLRAPRRHKRTSNRHPLAEQTPAAAPDIPLPPPPPSMRLSRRITSSLKRLLDEFREDDHMLEYRYTGMEPEDYHALLDVRSPWSFGKWKKQESKPFSWSQPATPTRHRSKDRKRSVDSSSLREQLMHKLRNTTNWHSTDSQQERPSRCNGGSVESKSSRFRPRAWMSRAASCERSESILRTPTGNVRSSSEFTCSSPSSSSSSSPSSSSSSSSSSTTSSHEDLRTSSGRGADLFRIEKRKSKLGRACSARELDRLRCPPTDVPRGPTKLHNEPHEPQRRRRHHRHSSKRKRTKSICQSGSSCCCAREFKLNNRPPVWNELSQVYQLDFGGRVTQESAKNLQIDFEGNLALQFGRIDRCTYTLDYKYPFNAVQAMAIALASLTQRLK